ncbi:hypothetical protein ABT034_18760 [Streptomyces sp. NPDC002773]|uniref:hypothetical protein n=1 Tax=Streptomyces sp. NPDC002773 TaxID=3154430 RepID=UPI00331A9B32
MSRKTMALVAGAVVAGVLAAGGWAGYRHLEGQVAPGEVLRGYDATTPAGVAPHSEDIFTGRVKAFEEQRDLQSWTSDIYRVEVTSVLRGDVRGTVRVTYAPEYEPRPRLADGETYVFATRTWEDSVIQNGHAQMFKGDMEPVDDQQLAVWREALTLLVEPGR